MWQRRLINSRDKFRGESRTLYAWKEGARTDRVVDSGKAEFPKVEGTIVQVWETKKSKNTIRIRFITY